MSDRLSIEEINRLVRGAWKFSNGQYSHWNSSTVAGVIFSGNGELFFAITPKIKSQHAQLLLERDKLYLSLEEMTSVVAFFVWALAQNEYPSLTQEAHKWLTWRKGLEQQRQELDKLLAQLGAKSVELR